MLKSWRGSGWELFCLLVFLILVSYQIFLPPVTGLANNSDFVYVLGKLSICPVDREKQDNVYLVTDYFVDPVQCTYDVGLVSTEVPLTIAATYLSAPFTGEKNFDLRALAALHLAVLVLAFGVLLSVTRRAGTAVRYGVPILFIAIFSDVAYTCYLNSVYLDAPSFVLLLATAAFAAAASLNHGSRWISAGYAVCGVALVFTKSQHAILGLIFAALALVLAFRPARRAIRIEWAVIAALLAGSTATMLSLTPPHYRLFALYNVIFGRLAPHSDAPWDVLKEVGLGDDDLKYLSTHAYVPNAPVYNEAWSADFLRRTSFGKLMWFYVRNPDVAFSEMNRDLIHAAPVLRPQDMANYREKDGFPPRAMASRFSLWSTIRSESMEVFPYQMLLIYLAPWVVWLAAWKRPQMRSPLLPLALALSAAGVMEFAMSSLTDALDTSRHMFLFQVITELLILMIAAALLHLVDRWRRTHRAETSESEDAKEVSPPAAGHRFRWSAHRPKAAWEILCFVTFFGLVGYQLFLPPVTGLANNGDFLKVLGPWSICSDHQPQNNKSLVTDYIVEPRCQFDLGIPTLERPLAGAARHLSALFLGERRFDLRFLAAMHLAILLLGFGILLRLTLRAPAPVRYCIPLLFILIFSDVAYTGYLNSAYMDASAFVLLVTMTVIATAACLSRNRGSGLITLGYLIAGLALVFSKSQHALLGVIFAIVAAVFAFRSTTLWRRVRWAAVALLLTGGATTMLAITPSSYSLFAIYSVIFARLGPHSAAPLAMLKELGLGEQDLQYMNTTAYTPGAPIYTELWAEDFLRRTSFADLIVYYLHHPSVPLLEMDSDLKLAAPAMRPPEMPNFREQDGIPPGTMATRFSFWSNLRSAALRAFPYAVLLFYLAPWVAAIAAWRRKMNNSDRLVMPLALALSAAGVMEFAMATLTDALDSARHLFIFHVITELLILLIAADILNRLGNRRPPLVERWRPALPTRLMRSVPRASVIKSVACTPFSI